ncbi:MAG: HlyC/CorC family transporter [Tissierellia bacterium]|nr:HlyC/CorC family transporter [Tissierellia bacterium]
MEDYGGSGSIWPQIVLIIILTGFNAIFAATEMAVVSLNRNKINSMAEEGDKKAKTLVTLLDDQTRFLSTIQVGITFAGMLSASSAATSMASGLGKFLSGIGIPSGEAVAVPLITLIIAYISLVFGELVPKRIALQNSEGVATALARFISLLSKLVKPFSALLSVSTKIVLKILGMYSEDIEEKISEEELKSYITVSQEQGVIDAQGKDMMINIFEFDDSAAYEIMTPRTEIFMVEYKDFGLDTVNEILSKGHSRIPVYGENKDDVLGIVYIKDLFIELEKNKYQFINIDDVIKEAYFVPESKKIGLLLYELRNTKNYMALLVDEYGGISGLVTIEDIVEEVVGEIEDEYDADRGKITKIGKNKYTIDGSVELKTINDELFTDLDSDINETIGGFAVEKLGFFPEEFFEDPLIVAEEDYIIEVLKVDDKRISEILLTIRENSKNGNPLDEN